MELARFVRDATIQSASPTEEYHTGRVGVVIEPIAAGAVGRAVFDGVVAARVVVTEAWHQYADVGTSGGNTLQSKPGGCAQILWRADQSQLGEQWAVVRVGRAADPQYFVAVPPGGIPQRSGMRPGSADGYLYQLDVNGDIEPVTDPSGVPVRITARNHSAQRIRGPIEGADDDQYLVVTFDGNRSWVIDPPKQTLLCKPTRRLKAKSWVTARELRFDGFAWRPMGVKVSVYNVCDYALLASQQIVCHFHEDTSAYLTIGCRCCDGSSSSSSSSGSSSSSSHSSSSSSDSSSSSSSPSSSSSSSVSSSSSSSSSLSSSSSSSLSSSGSSSSGSSSSLSSMSSSSASSSGSSSSGSQSSSSQSVSGSSSESSDSSSGSKSSISVSDSLPSSSSSSASESSSTDSSSGSSASSDSSQSESSVSESESSHSQSESSGSDVSESKSSDSGSESTSESYSDSASPSYSDHSASSGSLSDSLSSGSASDSDSDSQSGSQSGSGSPSQSDSQSESDSTSDDSDSIAASSSHSGSDSRSDSRSTSQSDSGSEGSDSDRPSESDDTECRRFIWKRQRTTLRKQRLDIRLQDTSPATVPTDPAKAVPIAATGLTSIGRAKAIRPRNRPKTAADRASRATAPGFGRAVGNWSSSDCEDPGDPPSSSGQLRRRRSGDDSMMHCPHLTPDNQCEVACQLAGCHVRTTPAACNACQTNDNP